MGLVYLAEQLSMNRLVALKVLRTELHSRRGARERFEREGRATAALTHPNIVRIYDVQHEGETYFLVMEYVEGQSLAKKITQFGRVPAAQALEYICQAAEGLQHAHRCGVIHRDIKPSNLLVDQEGVVKVLDMGLARFFDDRCDNLTERIGGGVLGSPDYLAPEQAQQQADIRSDIYALGATLYCLLIGEPPFAALRGSAKILAHQTRPVVPPAVRDPKIPQEISVIVLKMLAKSPEDRFQTMAEVLAALRSYQPPQPRTALPVAESVAAPTPQGEPESRTKPWPVVTLVGAFVASAIGTTLLAWLIWMVWAKMAQ
jgi:serine/threonine protein kinase